MIRWEQDGRVSGFPKRMATPHTCREGRPGCRLTLIRSVNDLATKAGGYEKLKELVDALAE